MRGKVATVFSSISFFLSFLTHPTDIVHRERGERNKIRPLCLSFKAIVSPYYCATFSPVCFPNKDQGEACSTGLLLSTLSCCVSLWWRVAQQDRLIDTCVCAQTSILFCNLRSTREIESWMNEKKKIKRELETNIRNNKFLVRAQREVFRSFINYSIIYYVKMSERLEKMGGKK